MLAIMGILRNPFFRTIIVPILLACVAALLQSAVALVRGKSKGKHRFRVWIRQAVEDGGSVIVPLFGQSVDMIRARNDVVDIDRMVTFDVGEFASVGIDLVIAAFATDIVSVIGTEGDQALTGYVLLAHVFMLVGIVLFTMLAQLAGPEEEGVRRTRSAIAIGLGMMAAMLSFLAV